MTREVVGNADRWLRARELVDAIEREDKAAESRAVQAICSQYESAVYGDLQRIASELRGALGGVRMSGELCRLAKIDLPDAQLRLNHVLEVTAAAAHTTLNAVETALPTLRNIASAIRALGPEGSAPQGARELCDAALADAALVERCLSEVLIAQGFQDITGQIIRRVAELVSELERHISGHPVTGDSSSLESPAVTSREEWLRRGSGPAVPGRDVDALTRQEDVDDLLGELGV